MQNYMSLFNAMRYNSEQEKTELMMSLIPNLCTECEVSSYLRNQLRYDDSVNKLAAFVREVAKISDLVVVERESIGHFERVLKEHISAADIAAVIKHIRSAYTKFFRIEAHIRNSTITPELQRILHIISFLHVICDRLKDGQEWLVHHDFDGPWTLYIMDEGNYFRTDKNPEPQQVVELDPGSHNPASLPDRGHNSNAVHAHLDELKAFI
jgi:hypothetical protein